MALIKSYHCGGETLGTVVKHSVRDSTPRAMPKAWQLNLVYNECYVAWECDGADGADKS